MYDFLGNTQIKCFPTPMLSPVEDTKGVDPAAFDLWYMDGAFRRYTKGDRVPYKTLWYDYGKNFMVFDYRDSEGNGGLVHIISGGKYIKSVPYDELNTHWYPIRRVISKTGQPLKIVMKYQFPVIISDYSDYSTDLYRKIAKSESLNREQKDALIGNILYDETNLTVKNGELLAQSVEENYKEFKSSWIWQISPYASDIRPEGPVNLGEFVYALDSIAKTDADVTQYVILLRKYLEENGSGINEQVRRYIEWCDRHDITMNDWEVFRRFFSYATSVANLKRIMHEFKIK